MTGLVLFVVWALALSLVVTWDKERGFGANVVVAVLLAASLLAFASGMVYLGDHLQWKP